MLNSDLWVWPEIIIIMTLLRNGNITDVCWFAAAVTAVVASVATFAFAADATAAAAAVVGRSKSHFFRKSL